MRLAETRKNKFKMRTGEPVIALGLYSSECCDRETILDVGDSFTRCPRCEGLCQWELVETLISSEDLEKLADRVA